MLVHFSGLLLVLSYGSPKIAQSDFRRRLH